MTYTVLSGTLNSTIPYHTLTVVDRLQFISGFQIEMSVVHTAVRPLLLLLGDYTNLTLNRIQVLSSLTDLFPNTFNEKLCEQLLVRCFGR